MTSQLPAQLALLAPTGMLNELPRRRLGRTGLQVGRVGLNFANAMPLEVIDFALDLGMNYFDTAHRYRGGEGERELAPLLARRRDEIVLATKWHRSTGAETADEILETLESSLRALDTDHLDVWMNDSVALPAHVSNELWLEAATRAKEQGKARFIGLSAWEGDLPAIATAAVAAEVYDVLHLRVVPLDLQLVQPIIAQANLGLVGMYVLSAARDQFISNISTPEGRQRAMAWALSEDALACALVETPTIRDVELYAAGAHEAELPAQATG